MNTYKISEIRQNQYLQVPKELFYSERYRGLSCEAKVLYSFLLDRMELSRKNNWVNKQGEIYLIFKRSDIMDVLQVSDKTCTKAFKQLADADLIKEKRQGKCLPNLIFIGHIIVDEVSTVEQSVTPDELLKEDSQNEVSRKNYDSGLVKITTPINKTNNNKTEKDISIHQEENQKEDGLMDYENYFCEKIDQVMELYKKEASEEYDSNLYPYLPMPADSSKLVDPVKLKILNQIKFLLLDIFTSQNDIKVNGEYKKATVVKNVFVKLNCEDIQRVADKYYDTDFEKSRYTENLIKNPRGYLISMLYNSVLA